MGQMGSRYLGVQEYDLQHGVFDGSLWTIRLFGLEMDIFIGQPNTIRARTSFPSSV